MKVLYLILLYFLAIINDTYCSSSIPYVSTGKDIINRIPLKVNIKHSVLSFYIFFINRKFSLTWFVGNFRWKRAGDTQQISFMLNKTPLVHSRTPANSSWNNSKFAVAKGCSLKSEGDEGVHEQMNMPGIRVPQAIHMQNAANGPSASKHTQSVVLNPGSFLLLQGLIPRLSPGNVYILWFFSSSSNIVLLKNLEVN